MKIKYFLIGIFLTYLAQLNAQEYTGYTVKLGSNAVGKTYYAGSLPKSSSSVYEKLKIEINGGSWHNYTTGENHYFISTRDGVVINQELHGGAISRYELKVYENGNSYDFVIRVNNNYPCFNIRAWRVDPGGYSSINITNYSVSNQIDISDQVEINQIFITDQYGNIGVGKSPNAKLDVAGNIKAHEIEVTLAAMQDLQLNGTLAANNITYMANDYTADFVFEDNYHLKNLSEVEAFIKINKHLPEIPSAAEMAEAGVNLAEMNKLLLMKVEELTLYSIELKKVTEKFECELEKEKELRGKIA